MSEDTPQIPTLPQSDRLPPPAMGDHEKLLHTIFRAWAERKPDYPQFQVEADVPVELHAIPAAEFGRDTLDGSYNFYRTERMWQCFLQGYLAGYGLGRDAAYAEAFDKGAEAAIMKGYRPS
jgi:hypothetical protein